MKIPSISIIIPIYKVEKYLKRCVESVRKQTLTDLEIIL
ncbi:MAG: glycosyltransferase family A protein, partial [Dorea sp.]|nr:glycosyltransferase family A protein [Dorea sp.]